jgi:hypothetical protein
VRALLLAIAAAVIAIVAADLGLGWYGNRHFLPEQRMHSALDSGDGCVLILGDSRMASAVDGVALHDALRRNGLDLCIADLSIGATDVSGAFLTARKYLETGRSPVLTVVGKVEDSLLDPDSAGPATMVGNNAIHLVWSKAGDVWAEIPGFPLSNLNAFDDGLRFLLARGTALGRYQSLLSVRIQQMQDRLTGMAARPSNRFGMTADMAALESTFRARANARLAEAVAAPGARSQWFDRLLTMLEAGGSRVLVVELPMPSKYRRDVRETPIAAAYRGSFAATLSARGHAYTDFGSAPWAADNAFADALHLNAAGAAHLSSDLGKALPIVLAPVSSHPDAR